MGLVWSNICVVHSLIFLPAMCRETILCGVLCSLIYIFVMCRGKLQYFHWVILLSMVSFFGVKGSFGGRPDRCTTGVVLVCQHFCIISFHSFCIAMSIQSVAAPIFSSTSGISLWSACAYVFWQLIVFQISLGWISRTSLAFLGFSFQSLFLLVFPSSSVTVASS